MAPPPEQRRFLAPQDIKALWKERVPAQFLYALARGFARAYHTTRAEVEKTYESPEAHDVRSHIRRAKVQGAFRATARQFPEIEVTDEKNVIGSANFVQAKIGPVVLTESSVELKTDLPRDAVFRRTLARKQLPFQWNGQDEVPEDDAMLYGIILHGIRSANLVCPIFLLVGFPNRECNDYVTWIGLDNELAAARMSIADEQVAATTVETVHDDLPLQLKPAATEKKADKAEGVEGA